MAKTKNNSTAAAMKQAEENRKLHDDAEAARQAKNFIKYMKGRE